MLNRASVRLYSEQQIVSVLLPNMQVQILRSKIHRARVTSAEVKYEGSLAIDQELIDRSGLIPYESGPRV